MPGEALPPSHGIRCADYFMNTAKFRIPQEIIERENAHVDKTWILGLDVGFSSLKGFCSNKYFTVPSYMSRLSGMLATVTEDDIYFEDESGLYLVGISALRQVMDDDTSDSDAEIFSRNRYGTKKFRIMVAVGLGLGLMENQTGQYVEGMPIRVQTGLPTAYMSPKDLVAIKKAFSEKYDFRLKIGTQPWKEFHICIPMENVSVMAQPSGTLYSILIDRTGNYVPEAKSILCSNILIVDAGFGTFDPYAMIDRKLVVKESIPDMGMLRVLRETSKLFSEACGEEIRVSAMQKYLEKGFKDCVDEETMNSKNVYVGEYLKEANRKVCMESIENIKQITNYLRGYDILVVTGGTGAAWFELYKDYFKGMKNLQVIPGNKNDGISMHYANVRGYYMLLLSVIKSEAKKS